MKSRICALLTVVLAAVCSLAQAAPVTYSLGPFTPSPGNALNMLTGTLTTDGTIGGIKTANILGWSFMVTGGFSISSADVNSGFQCIGNPGCFTATATTLSFAFDSLTLNDPFANFSINVVGSIQFARTQQSGAFPILAADASGTGRTYASATNVIGTAAPVVAAVPEPSALALVGIGLLAAAAFGRRLPMRQRPA